MFLNNKNLIKYIIVIWLLTITDLPFFAGDRYFRLFFLLFLFFIFFIKQGKRKLDRELWIVIIVSILIILVQGMRWGLKIFTIFSFIGFALLIPYLALRIVGIEYLNIFTKIISFISIYSLIFWLGQNFFSVVDNFFHYLSLKAFPYSTDVIPRSIIFYTIGIKSQTQILLGFEFYRNSGVFHEPGAYATFLDFAIAINLLIDKKLNTKKNMFLILCLLTTFSTAGILSLFVIYLFYYTSNRKKDIVIRIFGLIIILLIGVYTTLSVPFLGRKIYFHWSEETSKSLYEPTSGRIFGARKAIIVLKRYPLIGRGLITASAVHNLNSDEAAGYGFMKFFSRIGVILSIIFIIYFIKGIKIISFYFAGSDYYWQLIFFSLMINLFSQKFIADPFFFIIFYIGYMKRYNYNIIIKKRNIWQV